MPFDLEQLRRQRKLKKTDLAAMSYLLDRVNEALGQRVEEMAPETRRWLLIDFDGSALTLPGEVQILSLVERDQTQALRNVAEASVDGVVINLQLSWLDPGELLVQARRVLAPGGHLFFSSFGPDTLFELAAAWAAADDAHHVHPFIDLHHLGDALVKCGMEKPILDSDWIGVEYEDVDLLMDDLRGAGFHNVLKARRRTLTGKDRLEKVRAAFAAKPGPVQITWEVTYGYARKPAASADTASQGIRVNLSS